MIRPPYSDFSDIYRDLLGRLIDAPSVDVGEWHAQKVEGIPQAVSRELRNTVFEMRMPITEAELANYIMPNLPWAEDHFQERVSGFPMNPPPSHVNWPWASANEKHQTQDGEAFSHSYPERFWPRYAGPNQHFREVDGQPKPVPIHGIRFDYGDLRHVVMKLGDSPLTRQAYLPVFFPEDTGAHHGERIPCTLGYHFLVRDGLMHVTYLIRSCDLVRYFRDDVYMAARLGQWVAVQLDQVIPATLTFHCMSLHCFEGDLPKLRREHAPSK